MKQIPLGRGLFALVDAEDFDYLNQFSWYASWHDPNFYAVRVRPGKGPHIRMHRELLGLEIGDRRVGHHKNNFTLDNRRSNLEACTNEENMAYSKMWRRKGWKQPEGGAEVPEK